LVNEEITTERAGMWIPSDSVSVGEDDLDQPHLEELLDQLLEEGQQPRVVD